MPENIFDLSCCVSCPRECRADRISGRLGYCRSGADFGLGSICIHRGEEPVLGGARGVVNVFFTHCNLQCRYCQNYQISRNQGECLERRLDLPEILDRIERLLDQGPRTLGFVSPSHVLPQVRAILAGLHARGRRPTVVYNTNAYDRVESLQALAPEIGVYLPDLKYLDPELARTGSDAADYPRVAARALREMYRQKGHRLVLDDEGLLRSGLIVRHLVLPGQTENSKQVLRFIAEELSPDVTVSLMAQYAPVPAVAGDPDLGRPLRAEEYAEVVAELDRLGLENGWVQDLESRDHYTPDFEKSHPFE